MKKSKKTINKKVRNAESKEVNGIKFRSKLEAFTYNKLLEAGISNFTYEKDKFVLQTGFESTNISYEVNSNKQFDILDFKIRPITYTPDFCCINDKKEGWIIEVKGFANDAFPIKWKMFKKYLVDNGYNVILYKPNNQGNVLKCIELIKNK